MQTRDTGSTGNLATGNKQDDVIDCRMATLGLDLYKTEASDSKTLDEIRRHCADCGYREACVVDLKRDPYNPVWETYCPNSGKFIALTEAAWVKVHSRPSSEIKYLLKHKPD